MRRYANVWAAGHAAGKAISFRVPIDIFVSAEDIDGLIRLANRRRSEMKPDARKTFDEIDLLRIDFRLDGTVPGEQGGGTFTP